ncbi:hypothetical protein [Clostridium botulinum]|uniref:hypothetical protein n=1 Tax=Clostridium botulinum TaxID=1491 RepID=UPI00094736CA|nr:hypothetical protein [Clostridium botulinum]APQ76302.1 hypothetical protein RSJ10_438 [Clostridium botulinum]AUM97758.1 hypothetical protein RSJ13_01440 [Clostridium botulinum]
MFKINKLIMYGMNNEEYIYEFEDGINYFKGTNSSGKTEFYNFIDFMFGASINLNKIPWYKDTLKKATIIFQLDSIKYVITRNSEATQNYLYYEDEEEGDSIDLREYKEKLNFIFTKDEELLKNMRNFTDEELTYRSFTMFNFLGEKGQGSTYDFFDKCRYIKYSVKLAPILNFIFNNHLEEIFKLQQELALLMEEIKKLETSSAKFEFVCMQVNKNLQILGCNYWYTGKNAGDVSSRLNKIKDMQELEKGKTQKNIADLEVMYSNICEQIKVYENRISDQKQFEKENTNRKMLLGRLNDLVKENQLFGYLVNPLMKLTLELDNTISFSKYMINDNTIKELKKQRDSLKKEIRRNDSRFKCYSLEEKSKAIALIEEYLSEEIKNCDDELKEKRKRIREIKIQLKVLQDSDNSEKIKELSIDITKLYTSSKGISSLVDDDINKEGFRIQYIKKGNVLQPMFSQTTIDDDGFEKKEDKKYYTGSMARHTLIQLCGYLGFLKLLLNENKYPLIPILVIDHISKPFDEANKKAIGKVIESVYKSIDKKNLQIFMFDDEEYDFLALKPDHFENLVTERKTGFNPFYKINSLDNN